MSIKGKNSRIGESFVAEIIKDWEKKLIDSGLKLAYLPSPGIVKLRITAWNNEAELIARIDDSIENLKKLIPKYIFGEKDRIEEVVTTIKGKRFKSIVGRSCTGGNIAHLITGVSGSSIILKDSSRLFK